MPGSAAIVSLGMMAVVLVVLSALSERWKRTRATPRCNRGLRFVLELALPVWAFVGVLSLSLTTLFVASDVWDSVLPQPRMFEPRTQAEQIKGYVFTAGLILCPVVAGLATAFVKRRLRAWLARDPGGED